MTYGTRGPQTNPSTMPRTESAPAAAPRCRPTTLAETRDRLHRSADALAQLDRAVSHHTLKMADAILSPTDYLDTCEGKCAETAIPTISDSVTRIESLIELISSRLVEMDNLIGPDRK